MVTLEQVEKLREYADISYDEAKRALENADGDLLQALIDLEKQGKVKPPEGGGRYVSYNPQPDYNEKKTDYHEGGQSTEERKTFRQLINQFVRWLRKVLYKSLENYLVVEKNNEQIVKLPVLVLVLLLCFAFWFIIPLLIIGLFFNFRYTFNGPDLGKDVVNDAMDSVAQAAEDIKKDMRK